jgi:hypothetical protein
MMKLLGLALGIDVGDENDLSSKMETDDTPSSTKKETTTSKPTTTNNKPTESNKNSAPQQSPVRHFILSSHSILLD